MRSSRFIALLVLLAAVCAAQAQPSTFPARPIRMLIGWSAGGGTDIVARLVAARLAELLGKPVVVENKPGASGQLASMELAKSAPDGHTVLVQNITSAVIHPLTQTSLYHVVKDFQPVARIAKVTLVMIVNKDLPAANLREFIAWVKANPGKVTYGTGALGGVTHLAGEVFNKMAGTDMIVVPYKGGAAPTIQDLLGGRIDVIFIGVDTGISLIKSGKARAIAVTTKERSSMLPEVPTLAEAGLPQFDTSTWIALFTRSGVPAPVLARMEGETLKAIRHPETAAKIAELGATVSPMNATELDRFWKSEFVSWREALVAAKVKLD